MTKKGSHDIRISVSDKEYLRIKKISERVGLSANNYSKMILFSHLNKKDEFNA